MNNNKTISIKKNATLNTIKQIFSIIFPLITIPYATRILGTAYYGKVNYASSIISYFTLLAGLGINNYCVRTGSKIRDDKEKFSRFCNELFSINIISTLGSYVLLFILMNFVPPLKNYKILLLILSLQILFTTIGTDWVNTIFEDYLYISIRYVVCTFISLALLIIFVKKPEDYLIYAFTTIANIILANIANIRYIRKQYHLYLRFTPKLNLQVHIKPIMILFCTAVASIIYINSDITMLGIFTNEQTVGLYSSSAKLHSFIVQFFNSIQMVFIPHISYVLTHEGKSKVNKILNRLLGDLLLLIIPATAGSVILSKQIIILFCGAKFEDAYSSFAILNIALVFSVLSYYFYWVIMVPFQMERKFMIATILSAIVNVVLNIILIPFWGQNATALTTLISELFMFLLGIYYLRNVVVFNISRQLLIGIVGFFIVGVISIIVIKFNYTNLITILLSVILSILCYSLILFVFEKKRMTEITKFCNALIKRRR